MAVAVIKACNACHSMMHCSWRRMYIGFPGGSPRFPPLPLLLVGGRGLAVPRGVQPRVQFRRQSEPCVHVRAFRKRMALWSWPRAPDAERVQWRAPHRASAHRNLRTLVNDRVVVLSGAIMHNPPAVPRAGARYAFEPGPGPKPSGPGWPMRSVFNDGMRVQERSLLVLAVVDYDLQVGAFGQIDLIGPRAQVLFERNGLRLAQRKSRPDETFRYQHVVPAIPEGIRKYHAARERLGGRNEAACRTRKEPMIQLRRQGGRQRALDNSAYGHILPATVRVIASTIPLKGENRTPIGAVTQRYGAGAGRIQDMVDAHGSRFDALREQESGYNPWQKTSRLAASMTG